VRLSRATAVVFGLGKDAPGYIDSVDFERRHVAFDYRTLATGPLLVQLREPASNLQVLSAVFFAYPQRSQSREGDAESPVVKSNDALHANLSAHVDVRSILTCPRNGNRHFSSVAEETFLSTFRARVSAWQFCCLRHHTGATSLLGLFFSDVATTCIGSRETAGEREHH